MADQIQPDTINKLRNGADLSFAMLAGVQLDVFTPLKDSPMTLEQIAQALGVRPIKLRPLMYALVVAELLTVVDDRFSNTPEADRFLVKGNPDYIGMINGNLPFRWGALLNTAESIRTGVPQSRLDFSEGSEEELEQFLRGIQGDTIISGQLLAKQRDFSSCHTLADVGGGSGGLAIAVTEACPHIEATVIDLPTITTITQRIVDEAGASDKVKVSSADVVNGPLPGSYDVAVLHSLIQVLSPDDAVKALNNVFDAINPGGTIHIIGRTLDNSRLSPISSVGFSLITLNIYEDGQAYTEQEYMDWLSEAGFKRFELMPFNAGNNLITARKP